MPITGFFWNPNQGYDVHVLRNNQTSLRLDGNIYVKEEFPNSKIEYKTVQDINSGNVTSPEDFQRVFFVPSWQARATSIPPQFLENNGIRVNLQTGEITAQPQTAPRISSFVLTAFLRREINGAPQDFDITPRVMVHVHDQISSAWVTPSTLNVRPDIAKGISFLELRLASNKPVENIIWHSNGTFSQNIEPFLLIDNNPFHLADYPNGHLFSLRAPTLFDNRGHFPENDVFPIPIHLEIKYQNEAVPARVTIPTHQSHLLSVNQVLDDGAGNDLFEVISKQEKAQYRASVYATFDDDTMGDISIHHGLVWERGDGVDANDIRFESDGAFQVRQSAVGKTLEIKAKLPPRMARPGLTEVKGDVAVDDSWLNSNPVARQIPGSPTHLPADEVPNVLFIAEGFPNKAGFESVVLDVYNRLRSEQKTTPWNHLFTNRINAWTVFEESKELAASILYESIAFEGITQGDGNPGNIALPLFDLLKIGSGGINAEGGLTAESLVLAVGLPTPADANVPLAAKMTEWQQLFDPNFGNSPLTVAEDVFEFWRSLSPRRLVEERNTYWGLRCGEKPKIGPFFPADIISFNDPSRIRRANMDLYLSRIRANSADGDVIGERFWARDKNGKFGKDYGLIVFLTAGLRKIGTRLAIKSFPEGPVNAGIAVGWTDEHIPLNFLGEQFQVQYPYFRWIQSTGGPSFEIDPFLVPPETPITSFATIAHELGHCFGLEDEYAKPGQLNVPPQRQVDKVYNLQLHADLLDGAQLSGDRVKWRWPRMRKAGVLENAPAVGAQNTITITLHDGHTAQFAANEIVRLRHRDLLSTALDTLSSPELTIQNKDESNNTLILQPVSQATFNWTAFGEESLLYLPVKAPSEPINNPKNDLYAEVLAPLMRHHINGNNIQTVIPCVEDTKDVQVPVNLPADLNRPGNHQQIIGLYSGGLEFSCGIYHPSGECIMRKEFRAIFERVDGDVRFRNRELYQFCHVCRYSLVDQIDPTLHAEIDKAYEKVYPSIGGSSFIKKAAIIVGLIIVVVGAGYGIYLLHEKT